MPRNAILSLIFVAGCLIFPFSSSADNITLSGYAESGRKSQAEDFEEEENDSEYTYSAYHLNLKHQASDRFRYEIGTFLNNKDYEAEDALDNSSKRLHIMGAYYLTKQKKESSRLDFRFRYKVKRYDNSPSSEYNQIIFSPGIRYDRKNAYSLGANAGITSYDYVTADEKNEVRIFSKLRARAYLAEKTLVLVSSVRFDTDIQERKNRSKHRNNFLFGADYRISNPLVRKVSVRWKFGKSDTKDDDSRDDDYDYTYRQYSIKTDHAVHRRIKTFLKFRHFRKDYGTADLDHSAFSVSNSWRYVILTDTAQELYVNVSLSHKDVDYAARGRSDYERETLLVRGTYRKKKDWKTSLLLEGNFYDFDNQEKDRNRYYAKLLFEKPFRQKTVIMTLNLKYRYTDNRGSNNTEETSVRMALQYRL